MSENNGIVVVELVRFVVDIIAYFDVAWIVLWPYNGRGATNRDTFVVVVVVAVAVATAPAASATRPSAFGTGWRVGAA